MTRIILALALLSAPALAGSSTPDKHATAAYQAAHTAGQDGASNPHEGAASAIAAGKVVYASRCAVCHGDEGNGRGPAAVALTPAPADFTDGARWQASTMGTKYWVIQNGIRGTGMAAMALSEEDAWNVLSYVQATFAGPQHDSGLVGSNEAAVLSWRPVGGRHPGDPSGSPGCQCLRPRPPRSSGSALPS